jgi:hypothetical protein
MANNMVHSSQTHKFTTPGGFFEGMLDDIVKYLRDDTSRPVGNALYPEIFDTPYFFPLQRREEMRRMLQISQSISPEVVFEIGADKGSSFYSFIKSNPTARRAIASEIRGVPYSEPFQDAFPDIDFLWLGEISSYDPKTVERVRRWLDGEKIDVIFIDGDKGRMLDDFDAYYPLLSNKSVVFLHDVQDYGGPRTAFKVLESRGYRTEYILDNSDTRESMRREEKGIPPATAHEGWLRHWKGASCGVGVVYTGELISRTHKT